MRYHNFIIASIFSSSLFSNLSALSNSNSNYNELLSQWFPKDSLGLATEIPPGTSIALAQEEGNTGDAPEGNEEEGSNNDEEEQEDSGNSGDEDGDQTEEESSEPKDCPPGERFDSAENKCVSEETEEETEEETAEETAENPIEGDETTNPSTETGIPAEEYTEPKDSTQVPTAGNMEAVAPSEGGETSIRPPLVPPATPEDTTTAGAPPPEDI